jgi:hypothetical protein
MLCLGASTKIPALDVTTPGNVQKLPTEAKEALDRKLATGEGM